MNQYKIAFVDVDWESPIPGIRHKIVIDGGIKLRLVEFYPEMEPHWCEVGHFGQILEGTFEIEFNDGAQVFEEGDGVMIPTGAEHRHKAKVLTDVVRAIFVEKVWPGAFLQDKGIPVCEACMFAIGSGLIGYRFATSADVESARK